MGHTFVEKALARAADLPSVFAGQIIDVTPDVVLSHDNSAAIERIFRDLGADRVKFPERLAITLDHAVPAPTTLHAANHAEVRRFVIEQGIDHFFEAGRGICHQVLSEEALVLPGQTILGADSHTTHFGWLGAFGAGVGRSEVAALWATGRLWLRVPETIYVELIGGLPPWVTAKDLSLWVLKLLGEEAGIYKAIEFGGPGLAALSIESRMVIPNMMAEGGAKSAYLTPDSAVFEWLTRRTPPPARAQPLGIGAPPGGDGGQRWQERTTRELAASLAERALYPDPDADYVAWHTVDLSALEPFVACPHNPANVVPLSQVAGTKVDQAFLGTCTNGRLEDLAAAAAVLRSKDGQVKRIAAGTRMLVIPASSQVLQEAMAAGYIEIFVAAGAMLGTPGCGPCMGNHMGIPAPGEVTISSANRNFRGRMGTAESDVYLASPAVVAASAVAGRIVDPRDVTGSEERGAGSEEWVASGKSHELPELRSTREDVARSGRSGVKMGKNWPQAQSTGFSKQFAERPFSPTTPIISAPRSPLPVPRSGRVWKYGDNVNTDVIFPGKYTYTLREPAEWAKHALEDLDPSFAGNVQPGDIIVGGKNWGAGSSREQAVGCLKAAGVQAIVAASFARIFFRNAVNNGLLPVVCPKAVAIIEPGETISIDLDRCVVTCAAGEFAFPPLSDSLRAIVAAGGLIAMLKTRNP